MSLDNGSLLARLARLEIEIDKLQKVSKMADNNKEALDEIAKLVKGDPDLGVAPLRQDIASLNNAADEFRDLIKRGQWVAVGLGLGNAAQFTAFIVAWLGN